MGGQHKVEEGAGSVLEVLRNYRKQQTQSGAGYWERPAVTASAMGEGAQRSLKAGLPGGEGRKGGVTGLRVE